MSVAHSSLPPPLRAGMPQGVCTPHLRPHFHAFPHRPSSTPSQSFSSDVSLTGRSHLYFLFYLFVCLEIESHYVALSTAFPRLCSKACHPHDSQSCAQGGDSSSSMLQWRTLSLRKGLRWPGSTLKLSCLLAHSVFILPIPQCDPGTRRCYRWLSCLLTLTMQTWLSQEDNWSSRLTPLKQAKHGSVCL